MSDGQWKTGEYGDEPIHPEIDTSTISGKVKAIGKTLGEATDWVLGVDEHREELVKNRLDLEEASKTNNKYLSDLPMEDRIEAMSVSPEYTFNYDKALKDGISPSKIVDYIAENAKVAKIDEAREHFTDEQIVSRLKEKARLIHKVKLDNRLGVFATSDVVKGALKGLTDIYETEQDLGNMLGIQSDEENKKALNELHNLNNAIKDGKVDDIPYILGEIATSPLTFSPVAKGKYALHSMALLAGLDSGVKGYADARMEGDNVGDSLEKGAVDTVIGATTAGVAGKTIGAGLGVASYFGETLLNKVGSQATGRAKDILMHELNLSHDEMMAMGKDYAKMTGGTGDDIKDAVLGTMFTKGNKEGAGVTKDILKSDKDLLIAVKKQRKDRIKQVEDIAKKNGKILSMSEILNPIVDSFNSSLDLYSKAVGRIARNNVYKKPVKIDLPQAGDEIFSDPVLKADYNQIAKDLGEGKMGVADLVNTYKELNAIIGTISSKNGTRYANIKASKEAVKDAIRQSLTPEDYAVWTMANSNYAKNMEFMKKNAFGKAIIGSSDTSDGVNFLIGKNKTSDLAVSDIVNKLANSSMGENTFRELGRIINDPKKLEHIETSYIINNLKRIGKGEIDNASYNAMSKFLSKKSFSTNAGKNMTKTIEYLNDKFGLDDVAKKILIDTPLGKSVDIGSHSADTATKLGSAFLSSIIGSIPKALAVTGIKVPKKFHDLGEDLLAHETMARLLKKQDGYLDLNSIIDDMPDIVVRDKINQIGSSEKFKSSLTPRATEAKDIQYSLPIFNNQAIYNKAIADLNDGAYTFTKKDIDKLDKLFTVGHKIDSVKKMAKGIEYLDLDIVRVGGVSPEALAGAIHETGVNNMLGGIKHMVKPTDAPMKIIHNSNRNFNPTELKAGKKDKFLGKGAYFTNTADKDLHNYEFIMPKGAKILELPNKENYEYFLKSLGKDVDRDYANKLLVEGLGIDGIKTTFGGREYINILNNDLLDNIRATGIKRRTK